jgi:hypothetical protein
LTLLSITQVANLYSLPRKTVDKAVQRKYLKSTQQKCGRKTHLILDSEAESYYTEPPLPYWWSFQLLSLAVPIRINVLYEMLDSCEFRHTMWRRRYYAYLPGTQGIEVCLRCMGFLQYQESLITRYKLILNK